MKVNGNKNKKMCCVNVFSNNPWQPESGLPYSAYSLRIVITLSKLNKTKKNTSCTVSDKQESAKFFNINTSYYFTSEWEILKESFWSKW